MYREIPENILSLRGKYLEQHFLERGLKDIPHFQGRVIDKVVNAAHYFAENKVHDFTGMELAALISPEEWKTEAAKLSAVTYQAISRYYPQEYKTEAKKIGMPAIHLLRIEVGSNKSNLHELRGYSIVKNKLERTDKDIYPLLQTSASDWLEGITLPKSSEINIETARLFGYYWGIGTLMKSATPSKYYCLFLSNGKKYIQVMEEKVKPLMQKVHNIKYWDAEEKYQRTIMLDNKQRNLEGIIFRKTSLALTSFLATEHHFPYIKNKKSFWKRQQKNNLPKIPWTNETIDSFILGLIEVRGSNLSPEKYTSNTFKVSDLENISFNGEGNFGNLTSALLNLRGFDHNLKMKNNEWTIELKKEQALYYRFLRCSEH